jgi:hypothetical protein
MLRNVTEQTEFIRGRQLSEIVRFSPGMSENGREQLMKTLERPDAHWPANKTRMFFQIFTSKVSRDEVSFIWPDGEQVFRPSEVSINGEAGWRQTTLLGDTGISQRYGWLCYLQRRLCTCPVQARMPGAS